MSVYDVVIVGGGLVGGSLACALHRTGLRTCVIEAVAADAPRQPSYDERVIALSLGSRRIFGAIGIWSAVAPDVAPITRVHVSDRGHWGFSHLDAAEEGVEALGYVAPARSIGAAINARIGSSEDIDVLRPARLVGLSPKRDYVHMEVATAGTSRLLQARLLVAADGGDSGVRKRLGLRVREQDYGYDAVISTVTAERAQPGTAFERFTDTGPLAMLPMTEGRYSVVWTARESERTAILGLDDDTFIERLQQRFGYRLGRLSRPGRRIAYPLRLVLATRLTSPRVVLVGNAAHTLHPVAGQGFNLGLRDVAELADLLEEAKRTGRDPGGDAVVAEYGKRRRRDQSATALATDALARLFVNPWSPVRLGRNLGMLGLDCLPAARHWLAGRFMGTRGRLPRLARGIPLAEAASD